MNTDPIVEQVRFSRKQVEKDASAKDLCLGDYLRQKEKSDATRIVCRHPQLLQKRRTA
jgi:hypothetical protein